LFSCGCFKKLKVRAGLAVKVESRNWGRLSCFKGCLWQGNADGDGVPRRRVGGDPSDFAGEQDFALQQFAELAVAEARNVAEFQRPVQNLDGIWIVRIVGLRPERQRGAGLQFSESGLVVVMLKAGDGEGGLSKSEIRKLKVEIGTDLPGPLRTQLFRPFIPHTRARD
jgi:hypothetical protein